MRRILLQMLCYLWVATLAQAQGTTTAQKAIPFTLDGHIYLNAVLNGKYHGNIVFDTGASDMLLLDTLFIREQHWTLTRLANAMAPGAVGIQRLKVAQEKVSIDCQGRSETYPWFVLLDLRGIVGKYADGLIGMRDLKDHPFEINYQHQFIRPLTVVPDSVKRTYACLPLVYDHNKMMIHAEVYFDGKCLEGLYHLDTGSGNGIDFTAEATEKYKLTDYQGKTWKGKGLQMGVGDHKISTWIDARSDSMAIGPIAFDHPEITLNPEGKGSFGKNVFIGNIGAQLLSKLNLVIDLPARKIYLKKFSAHKQATPTNFAFSWLNRTDIGAGWIVRSMDEGGVADRAGILLGDTIIAVNGRDVKSIQRKEEWELSDLPEMSVTIQRGKEVLTIKMVAEDRWK